MEGLKVASQVGLVACSVLGAAALLTANPAFSFAALGTLMLCGHLLGLEISGNILVDKWRSEAVKAN